LHVVITVGSGADVDDAFPHELLQNGV
jgi:hypothetical protein